MLVAAIINSMEQGKLLPDISWMKPLAQEAARSLHALNDKLDAFREDRLAFIGGLWMGGITVAVVLLSLFVFNLARRK